MRLAWVAVPVPALDLLTYLVPDSFDLPAVGARVLVPLGSRRVTGCVVRTSPPSGQTPPLSGLRGSTTSPRTDSAFAGGQPGVEQRVGAHVEGRTSDDGAGEPGISAGELCLGARDLPVVLA